MNLTGNGLDFCFGRHTGYGGYGTWTRGSRQIFVTEEMLRIHALDSWIRLETREVVGKVSLNDTYGHDRYDTVPTTSSNDF